MTSLSPVLGSLARGLSKPETKGLVIARVRPVKPANHLATLGLYIIQPTLCIECPREYLATLHIQQPYDAKNTAHKCTHASLGSTVSDGALNRLMKSAHSFHVEGAKLQRI